MTGWTSSRPTTVSGDETGARQEQLSVDLDWEKRPCLLHFCCEQRRLLHCWEESIKILLGVFPHIQIGMLLLLLDISLLSNLEKGIGYIISLRHFFISLFVVLLVIWGGYITILSIICYRDK